MKRLLTAAAFAAAAFAFAAPATAISLPSRSDVAPQIQPSVADPVHWRRRHYRSYAFVTPYFYIGPRYRHHYYRRWR